MARCDECGQKECCGAYLGPEVDRLRAALDRIAERPWVEHTLDPQWSAAVAREALATDVRSTDDG